MTTSPPRSRSTLLLAVAGGALLVLGALAGWLFESRRSAGTVDRAAVEEVVRNYLLENPEILPEAIERLRAKEAGKQRASVGDAVEDPFPGAVLGNPAGKIVLVEFSDYACGFCRRSVDDVKALIAANPDLKVVMRELPILSPASAEAARWALAAADQGKFAEFHHAMFAAGRPDPATIEATARAVGMDLERARRSIADPRIAAEFKRNQQFAEQLGFDGTPSWLIGDQIFSGAVGREELAKAIAATRG